MKNAIIEELRRIREEYAARCNYDIQAMGQDLRRRELKSAGKLVDLKPRRIVKK